MVKALQIKDFPDYYITDTGYVYSRKYHPIRNKNNRIKKIKSWLSKHGYLIIDLFKEKHKIHKPIHRLVAEAFIPNPENKPEINHKNGIKTDNRVENLEWCSYTENLIHAYNILGRTKTWKNKFGKNHNRSKTILQIKNRINIAEFGSLLEAERETGIHHSSISMCCHHKRLYAGGFQWKYKD